MIGAEPVKSVPPLTSLFPEQCASLKAVMLYVPVFKGETLNVYVVELIPVIVFVSTPLE